MLRPHVSAGFNKVCSVSVAVQLQSCIIGMHWYDFFFKPIRYLELSTCRCRVPMPMLLPQKTEKCNELEDRFYFLLCLLQQSFHILINKISIKYLALSSSRLNMNYHDRPTAGSQSDAATRFCRIKQNSAHFLFLCSLSAAETWFIACPLCLFSDVCASAPVAAAAAANPQQR